MTGQAAKPSILSHLGLYIGFLLITLSVITTGLAIFSAFYNEDALIVLRGIPFFIIGAIGYAIASSMMRRLNKPRCPE